MNVASAMVEGAELRLRSPRAELRSYLGCFWSLTTAAATRLRALPDGCATLSIERLSAAETCREAPLACFFAGPRLTPAERWLPAGRALAGVRLRPGVAFALTGIPTCRLVGRRLRLSAVLPAEAPLLEALLAGAREVEQQLDALEDLLARRLAGARIDPRVEEALRRIADRGGQIRISDLARACRVSPRHLDRLMLEWVGIAPKRLARIGRFQALLESMEAAPGERPARVAPELGYFDQAHMANEAARFAGASPGRIAARHVADFSKTRCE